MVCNVVIHAQVLCQTLLLRRVRCGSETVTRQPIEQWNTQWFGSGAAVAGANWSNDNIAQFSADSTQVHIESNAIKSKRTRCYSWVFLFAVD